MWPAGGDRHVLATTPMHVYEVRPRNDQRGVDLIPMCCRSVGCVRSNYSAFKTRKAKRTFVEL